MHVIVSVDADTHEYRTNGLSSRSSSSSGSSAPLPLSGSDERVSSPAGSCYQNTYDPTYPNYQPHHEQSPHYQQHQMQEGESYLYHQYPHYDPQQPLQHPIGCIIPTVTLNNPAPTVTGGHGAKIAPSGLQIKVGCAQTTLLASPAQSCHPALRPSPVTSVKFTTTRTTTLMALPPPEKEDPIQPGKKAVVPRSHSSSDTVALPAAHPTIAKQLQENRNKQIKRDNASNNTKRERTRADEGTIPVHSHITMNTPFFIPADTPVMVCSSRDGVWRKGFTWRDNTRRVFISSLAENHEDGPVFTRTADVALFDARKCPCDLDAMTTRPCYIKVDVEAVSVSGGATFYWKQSDGASGGEFSPVQVPMLNYYLGQ